MLIIYSLNQVLNYRGLLVIILLFRAFLDFFADILEKYDVKNDENENGERPLVVACGRKSGNAISIAVLLIEEMVSKYRKLKEKYLFVSKVFLFDII